MHAICSKKAVKNSQTEDYNPIEAVFDRMNLDEKGSFNYTQAFYGEREAPFKLCSTYFETGILNRTVVFISV